MGAALDGGIRDVGGTWGFVGREVGDDFANVIFREGGVIGYLRINCQCYFNEMT